MDIKLIANDDGSYDYEFGEDGDYIPENSRDTDIVMSLDCDRRASSNEIPSPERRRGWLGDVDSTMRNYEIGSKLWLLEQSRFTQETANEARDFVKDCLQHFIDKGEVTRIQVSAYRENNSKIIINIRFYVDKELVLKSSYNLWKKSVYA